jgi:DNA adenine methylase
MYIPKNNVFKWIGGKKWLEKDIQLQLENLKNNDEIDVYIEPFLGGLGSFKAILPTLIEKNVKKIILNDINLITISVFKSIQDNLEEFISEYVIIEKKFREEFSQNKILCKKKVKKVDGYEVVEGHYHYFELNKTRDKEELKEKFLQEPRDYFNKIKKEFNKDKLSGNITVKTLSKFLFLMQNCFNGVYRENLKGEFNVPYNWNSTLSNLDNKIKDLKDYNKLFNEVDITFTNKDVFDLLDDYKNLDNVLIYLDPPYLNEDGAENKYNKDHFGFNEQIKLLNYTNEFDYVLYSNHNSSVIKDFFEKNEDKTYIKEVFRKNIMSASNESRKEDKSELLVLKMKESK